MVDYQPMDLNLAGFADEALSLFEYKVKQKGIDFKNNIDESIIVYVDNSMTDVIFRNLISNAVKFTANNGSISVSAVPKEDFTEITVADTGIGLTQEEIIKLFKIEFKVSKTGTDGREDLAWDSSYARNLLKSRVAQFEWKVNLA
jgi:two-component system sensor histidine kinase/response regulator